MPLIRRAELNDAAPIARVHVDSWRSSYQGLLPDAYLDTLSEIRVAASWSEILKRRNRSGATFVADAEAEGVVGFADCGPERGGPPATGEITTLYLLDEWQQRGLGRRLVATAARHLGRRRRRAPGDLGARQQRRPLASTRRSMATPTASARFASPASNSARSATAGPTSARYC